MVALVMAAEVRRDTQGVGRRQLYTPTTLVMTFADDDQLAEFLALLRGEPYPPTRTGRP